jgi:hypothetical protein
MCPEGDPDDSEPIVLENGATIGFKHRVGNGEIHVGSREYTREANVFEGTPIGDILSLAYTKTGVPTRWCAKVATAPGR